MNDRNQNVEFERQIDDVTFCRLTGQFGEAREFLLSLTHNRHLLSTFQKNLLALEKAERHAELGYPKRAETVLRKAIRASFITANPPEAITSWSHSLLVANLMFLRIYTRADFEIAVRTVTELGEKLLADSSVPIRLAANKFCLSLLTFFRRNSM